MLWWLAVYVKSRTPTAKTSVLLYSSSKFKDLLISGCAASIGKYYFGVRLFSYTARVGITAKALVSQRILFLLVLENI